MRSDYLAAHRANGGEANTFNRQENYNLSDKELPIKHGSIQADRLATLAAMLAFTHALRNEIRAESEFLTAETAKLGRGDHE